VLGLPSQVRVTPFLSVPPQSSISPGLPPIPFSSLFGFIFGSWLSCPISGVSWRDKEAILGVGVYHAPRFLTEDEKRRQSEVAKRALARQKAAAAAAAAAAAPGDEEEPSADESSAVETEVEESDKLASTGPVEMFQVYPTVEPPPQAIPPLKALPDSVRCGHVEVIIGPVFDIIAYNDGVDGNKAKGIPSRKARGGKPC